MRLSLSAEGSGWQEAHLSDTGSGYFVAQVQPPPESEFERVMAQSMRTQAEGQQS
jgi:hypothetical protein